MKNGMLRKCAAVVALVITFAGSAVASSTWSGPLVLGNGGWGDQMEFDSSGNALAVWVQGPQGTTLQAGHYDKASNTWTVEQLPGVSSVGSSPSLSVAANGDAIVAWTSVGGSEYASLYTAATNSWNTTPTPLGNPAANYSSGGTITSTAITRTGLTSFMGNRSPNATVAWAQCIALCVLNEALWDGTEWEPTTQLWASSVGTGPVGVSAGLGTLTPGPISGGSLIFNNTAVVLSTPANGLSTPTNEKAGADPNPALYINTYNYRLTQDIINNTWSANGTWSAPSLFWTTYSPIDNVSQTNPQIAFDDNNNGFAVWIQDTNLMVRRYNASSGWSTTPVPLAIDASSPSLAVDPGTGNAVLAYTVANAPPAATYYSTYVSLFNATTAGWSTPTLLGNVEPSTTEGVIPGSLVTAIRGGGNAVVGWVQSNSNSLASIFEAARWNGTAWGAAETLVPPTNTSVISTTAVGIDAWGYVSAMWSQDGNVYLNYYGPVVPSIVSAWTGPHILSSTDGTARSAIEPLLGVDAQGNGIAVWVQNGTELLTRRYDKATNSWGVAQVLATNSPNQGFSNPSLSVDDSGDAIVSWAQAPVSGGLLYVIRYSAATGSWDPSPTQLSVPSTTQFMPGSINATSINDVVPGGNAMAAVTWLQMTNDGQQDIIYAALWNGSSWGPATPLGSASLLWQGSVGVGNIVYAMWMQAPPGGQISLYTNTYNPSNGGWSGASLLASGNFSATHPQVAFDNQGNGFAVWAQNGAVMAQRYDAARGWSAAPVAVADGTPVLSIDPETGDAILALYGSTSVLVSRYLTETDTWATPTLLNNSTSSGPMIVSMTASNRGGHAVVGWLQVDSNNVTSSYNVARWNGSGWGAPETIGPSIAGLAPSLGLPVIAVDAQGNVTALWWQSVGNVSNIYINYYGPVAPSL